MKKEKKLWLIFLAYVIMIGGIFLSLISCSKKGETITKTKSDLSVAYIEMDSVWVHFNLYTHLFKAYENKVNIQKEVLNLNYQKFQKEALQFQQKVQSNVFLTQEAKQQEQIHIQTLEENFQKRVSKIEKALAAEQKQMQQKLSDSLSIGIKEFNTPQKYQLILTNTGRSPVLYANERYNITDKVINFLNKRFK